MASREGLIRMYQKLLVEKEQRLHDLMHLRRSAMTSGAHENYDAIVSSRYWRLIMRLHRIRHRLGTLKRKLGLADDTAPAVKRCATVRWGADARLKRWVRCLRRLPALFRASAI